MSIPHDYYTHQILELETRLKAIKKTISYLYLGRLFSFLAFIALLILFVQSGYQYVYLTFSLLMLVFFLMIVKYDLKLVFREKFWTHKLIINRHELDYLSYSYDYQPRGDGYSSLNPHLAADFDIFGEGSLFQYLNRCSTGLGRDMLAANLCRSELNESIIRKKQAAIRELSTKQEFIQHFQTYGMFITEHGTEVSSLLNWVQVEEEGLRRMNAWSISMIGVNVLCLILVIAGALSVGSLAFPLMLSLTLVGMYNRRIMLAHTKLGNTTKTFEKYSSLIKLIEDEGFTSSHLNEIKEVFGIGKAKASHSLGLLFKLLSRFDIRYNVIVSFLLNAFLVFDIRVYLQLIRWKLKHRDKLEAWFQALSELDMLISMATYAYNNQEDTVYPLISEDDFAFQADEMGHPLISPALRVTNSFQFRGKPAVVIITGANMAGKSTFLRTVAINLLLGMNGAPVCAKGLIFKPMDIMSSIKIQDSLARNESYFYAELLRLKEILQHVEMQPATLVVLDEILRGTNTRDKQLGTIGLLEKLISLKSVVMIATHDLVIGELEQKYPAQVRNHCFEVELSNDQLVFDYKLKDGISQKLNASVLLRKMEII